MTRPKKSSTPRADLGKLVRRFLKERWPDRIKRGVDWGSGERVWTHAKDGSYDSTANFSVWPWAYQFEEWLEEQPYEDLPEGDIEPLSSYEVGLKLWVFA